MLDVERITARNQERARMEEALRRMQQRKPQKPRRPGIAPLLYLIAGGLLAVGFAGMVLPGTDTGIVAAYLGLAAVCFGGAWLMEE